jgi:hypothetical protein
VLVTSVQSTQARFASVHVSPASSSTALQGAKSNHRQTSEQVNQVKPFNGKITRVHRAGILYMLSDQVLTQILEIHQDVTSSKLKYVDTTFEVIRSSNGTEIMLAK